MSATSTKWCVNAVSQVFSTTQLPCGGWHHRWTSRWLRLCCRSLRLRGFADVVRVPGNELVERLATSYSRVGIDETIVVTRSNKRANIYNQGIRAQVLDCDDMLCGSDRVMVVKNKYLKPEPSAAGTVAPLPASTSTSTAYAAMQSAIAGKVKALQDNMRMQTNAHQPANVRQLTFIANGDRCIIQRVRHFREFYGFHFADATLRFPDYDDQEAQTMVLLDTLSSEAPSLTHDQQTKPVQQCDGRLSRPAIEGGPPEGCA